MIYKEQISIPFISKYLSILLMFLSVFVNVMAQDSIAFRYQEPIDLTVKTEKDHKNWITPTIAAVSYASFTYLVYRNFDSDIETFSQQNQNHFTTTIANGVSYFGLGKVQSIALAGTAVIAFAFNKDKLKSTTIIWAASLLMNSTITDQHLSASSPKYRRSV